MIKNDKKLKFAENVNELTKLSNNLIYKSSEVKDLEDRRKRKLQEIDDLITEVKGRLLRYHQETRELYDLRIEKVGFNQTKQQMLDNIVDISKHFAITNDDLCSLLEEKTGKKWKIRVLKELGSYADNFHLVALNKDNELFDETNKHGCLEEKESCHRLAFIGNFHIEEKEKKKMLSNINWMYIYLMKKFGQMEDVNLKLSILRTTFYNFVLGVIDEYVTKVLQDSTESDGENE